MHVVFVFLISIAEFAISAAPNSFSNGNIEVLCKESERQALLTFKKDLKDPMNRFSSWVDTEADCCSWTGVACDNLTGHVRELRLGNPYDGGNYESARYELGGKINPSLLNLKYLNFLNLSNNNFDGIPIPSFLGSLKSLTHLDLSNPGFGGLIPHQLGNLSSLRYLNLRNSYGYLELKVEKLHWISGLTSLQYIDMSGVNMSKAYDWVQVLNTLPSLVELRLSGCELGNISPDLPITNFTSLSIFDVSENGLFGLPKWLFNLRNLKSLYLQHNFFGESFPLGLTNMTRLEILDLSYNPLNSTIPQWFGRLNHLEFLDLSNNTLHGNIPASFGNLTSMVSVKLARNQLQGKIPKSLENLSGLREIQLSNNQLSGQFTNQLGKFRNLTALFISDNLFFGDIATDIGNLLNLQVFDASNNQLNGSLPESFGQLSNLVTLDISHNSLKGLVSEVHFSNLTRLKFLYASENSLTLETSPNWVPPFQLDTLMLNSWNLGPNFPLWLRWQQHLFDLRISNTRISDTIPLWFCNISSQMSILNLSYNQFHGEFPCTTYSLSYIDLSSNKFNGSLPFVSSEIAVLDLTNNSFSGSVSHFFCNKVKYQNSVAERSFLYLGNNLLTGAIPECWTKLKSLKVLDLENNNLVGVIPSSIGNLSYLSLLNLRNNSIFGELPLSLENNAFLTTLELSGNKLSGKIPKWIWTSLSSLVVLNLRSNNFEGDIPLQLCNLKTLQVLDLAHNNLSGTIPRCFFNLSAMSTMQWSSDLEFEYASDEYDLRAEAKAVTKGREVEYRSLLGLVKSMDLSGNNLDGEIPMEMTRLHGLQTLNLSKNHLVGKIPWKIGDMKWLESLDLSQNKLSGKIPPSISDLSFLSYLNFSCNNLIGSIPTGTQLQSFNESSFISNQLCGLPLQNNCSATDQSIPPGVKQGRQQDSFLSEKYLYLSLGLGFAFGFWAILGSLLVNMPWSVALSGVVDRIVLKLYAFIIEKF